MATRFQAGILLDFESAAFNVVSGNASGTTPKVSGWIRVIGIDRIDWLFVTGATTNVTWTIDTSYDAVGSNADSLPAANILDSNGAVTTLPTGTNQNATRTIVIPDRANYIRITGTPSAGSGAVEASPGLIVGKANEIPHCRQAGVHLFCLASATLAGQAALKYSANYNPPDTKQGRGTLPPTTGAFGANPERWFAAMKSANDGGAAISIGALSASTGQDVALELGLFSFEAMRGEFTPSAGFGRYTMTFNAKG